MKRRLVFREKKRILHAVDEKSPSLEK